MPQRAAVERLFFSFLDCWNARDAAGMAALCAPEAHIIGFDGSEMVGPQAVEAALSAVFADHRTPAYVATVRAFRQVGEMAIVRAVAGMIPDGQEDLDPALNAVQTLVASHRHDRWVIEVLQHTPAAYHGRPGAAAALTQELRDVLLAARPRRGTPDQP